MTKAVKADFQSRWEAVCDQKAGDGDSTIYRVYVGGVWYSVAEYAAILFNAARAVKDFGKVSAGLFPLWNFLDAIGVIVDGGKDQKNGDKTSAYINYFSGIQLIGGTSLGVVVRALKEQSAITPAIGMTAALTTSAATFAVCMFCSAIVAQIKVNRLKADLADLYSNNEKKISRVMDNVVKKHPEMAALQKSYSSSTQGEQKRIRNRFAKVLNAEIKYQQTAVNVWLLCGIAMTCVAVMTVAASNPLLIATCILMIASVYGRYLLRESEKQQDAAVKASAKPLTIHYDKSPANGSEDNSAKNTLDALSATQTL